MRFVTVIDKSAVRFAQPIHGKKWAQQTLQRGAVVCLNADTGINREAAVLVGQHLFGISLLDQAPPDKGEQDAPAQIGLRFSHDSLINATGRVKTKFLRTKNHPRRCGLVTCISTYFA